MTSLQLLHNPDTTLLSAVIAMLRSNDCVRVDAAVSYVHLSGVALMYDDLRAFVEAHHAARFVVAVDQGITSFEGLQMLLASGVELYVYRARAHSYHAKTWLFSDATGPHVAVVGSGNITGGGLVRSVEIAERIEADDAAGRQHLAEHRLVIDRICAGARAIPHQAALETARDDFRIPSERRARGASPDRQPSTASAVTTGLVPAVPPRLGEEAKAWIEHEIRAAERLHRRRDSVRRIQEIAGVDALGVAVVANPLRRPRTPGELRLPLPALRLAPSFWDWPRGFRHVTRQGSAYDERHVPFRFISAGDPPGVSDVRVYVYPRRSEFRLTSAEFRNRADAGDIIVITKRLGVSYQAQVVRQSDANYASLLAKCTETMPGGRHWTFL